MIEKYLGHLRTHQREIPEPDVRVRFRGCRKHTPCYRLNTEYEYVDDFTFDVPVRIRLPRFYHSDGASVPRPVHPIIGPLDLSVTAFLVHDYITQHAGVLPFGAVVPYRTYSILQTHRLFKRIMDQEGVPEWREFFGYAGVLVGGWIPWLKNKRRSDGS